MPHKIRVRFIRLIPALDADGNRTLAESDLGIRWCEINAAGSDDPGVKQEIAEIRTHVIITHGRPAPCKPGDLAEYQGERFAILDCRNDPETGALYLDSRTAGR